MTVPRSPAPLANTICPLCGGSNQYTPASAGTFDVECWCTRALISPDALARIPDQQIDKACLCPRCASGAEPIASMKPGAASD